MKTKTFSFQFKRRSDQLLCNFETSVDTLTGSRLASILKIFSDLGVDFNMITQ